METTLPAFTPMQESPFLTLCGRALDNRSPQPILADKMAEEIVRKLDYDCAKFRLSASPILNIALRAKNIDEVALRFVTSHPDAVALDLGAGLDTRMFRIAPPPAVDWYDVELLGRVEQVVCFVFERECESRKRKSLPLLSRWVHARGYMTRDILFYPPRS